MNTRYFQPTASAVIGYLLSFGLFTLLPVSNTAAENFTDAITSLQVSCSSSAQLCEPPFSTVITTDSMFKIEYSVPSGHCSSVRLHIFVDGSSRMTTGFLGWVGAPPPFDTLPLSTGPIDLGPVSSGPHVLAVQAEGQPGWCTPSPSPWTWGGTLHVYTNSKNTSLGSSNVPSLGTANTLCLGSLAPISLDGSTAATPGTSNTICLNSSTPISLESSISASLGGSITRMDTSKGKVICRNFTKPRRKRKSKRLSSGTRSWNCEQAGLPVLPGDRIEMTVTVKGRAD